MEARFELDRRGLFRRKPQIIDNIPLGNVARFVFSCSSFLSCSLAWPGLVSTSPWMTFPANAVFFGAGAAETSSSQSSMFRLTLRNPGTGEAASVDRGPRYGIGKQSANGSYTGRGRENRTAVYY